MFFKHNTQLGPPYQVLVDTNFINFSIRNKVRLACQLVHHQLVLHFCCAAPVASRDVDLQADATLRLTWCAA
jgi:rRNA-processing protein FCF1